MRSFIQFNCKKKFFKIVLILIIFGNFPIIGQPNIDTLINLGELFEKNKKYEQAYDSYNQGLDKSIENGNWENANKCTELILFNLQRQKKFREIIATANKLLPLLKKNGQYNTFLFGRSLVLKGRSYRKFKDYSNSLKTYLEAINIFEDLNTNDYILSYTYRNAAQIYLRRLDYVKAVDFFNKALKADSTQSLASSIHRHLAFTNTLLENYEEAIKHYKYIQRSTNSSPIITARMNIIGASVYFSKKEYSSAINSLKEAEKALKSLKGNEDLYATIYFDYAQIFHSINKKQLERQYILNTILHLKKAYVNKDREAAKLHANIGLLFFEDSNLDSALSHYQQALIQVFPNFNSTNIADNPSIHDIYTESWIMTASARKGEALRARYELNNDINDLINAAECFDLSIAGIKALTNSYGTDNAKLYLSDYSHNYFEEAIEVNYLLFKETSDQQYLEKIFSIMERSKASVLTEAIQKNRGLILAGIPDSLLGLEQDLRLELADLNKSIKLEELYEAEADEERISELRSRMTTRQREYEELLANLKNDFPQFKSFIEEPVTSTIVDVQQFLSEKGETLLEYFVGGKHIYLIQIDGEGASVYQMPHSEFWGDQVADFQDYFRNSSAIINDPKGYFAAAETLYQQLFPFDSLPDKIILVPDGALNFVPFDALVAEQPEQLNFTEANFLLRTKQIRYAYSAGLLLSQPPSIKSTKEFLRIAPLFANRERGQAPLANGNQPIEHIPQLQTLTGATATFATFQNQAPKCKLVHLSTHAGADETDFAPRIEFIDTSLYLPELYAMKIPAELVVLSACETGLGKFEKGEGVMSLARGFAYAGAGSLVASLWKVNEGSTAALFDYFYSFLSAGKTKSEALRDAKLQYLQEAKSEAKMSPYYWSGFVSIGHDDPMDFRQNKYWWVLPTLLGFGILLLIWKRIQSRKVIFGRTPPRHEKGVVSN